MTAPSIDTIKRVCAGSFQVSLIDLESRRQDKMTVIGRHSAIWLAWRLTKMTAPQIGRHFGDRDHKTVLNAVTRMEQRIRSGDPKADMATELFLTLKMSNRSLLSTETKSTEAA